MPKTARIPKPCHHKASGQAVVRLNSKDYYLGPWNSAAALAEYDRLINEWLSGGRRPLTCGTGPTGETGPTVNDVILAYDQFAEAYYQAGPLGCVRDALKIVKALYGRTLAAEFGPKKLKAVRQA